ncbi:MAG: asparaginase domain-containing protein [Eubacterium sp.]|nr:asparaginase domain-containing protein [Eubacterium sp.]
MYPITHPLFLLQTGGTIGSAINDGTIDVDPQKGDVLIDAYQKSAPHRVDFTVARPFTILSENLTPSHWSKIIDVLKGIDFSDYEGIIITHGSDTLSYTAAALSYFFAQSPIPIVLVCANHPLGHPQSNGLANFSAAVDFILNARLPGIFIIYENSDGRLKIHLGTRTLEADWILDDFESFGGRPFALKDGHCLSHGSARLSPAIEALRDRPLSTDWGDTPMFDKEVLALKTYPGMDYGYISFAAKAPAAVLHLLYHSASGNYAGPGDTSLAKFIAEHPETDHYLISYKDVSGDLYASCHALIEAGGIPLENICFEAAVTKLYFAYSQNNLTPQAYMKRPLFFEFL